MTSTKRKNSGLWVWIIIGLIVATLVFATIYYIGWFDYNTHVDTPAGDNVTQQYELTEAGADSPGEADWQNTDHRSIDEIITEPETETPTAP